MCCLQDTIDRRVRFVNDVRCFKNLTFCSSQSQLQYYSEIVSWLPGKGFRLDLDNKSPQDLIVALTKRRTTCALIKVDCAAAKLVRDSIEELRVLSSFDCYKFHVLADELTPTQLYGAITRQHYDA